MFNSILKKKFLLFLQTKMFSQITKIQSRKKKCLFEPNIILLMVNKIFSYKIIALKKLFSLFRISKIFAIAKSNFFLTCMCLIRVFLFQAEDRITDPRGCDF